MRDIEEGEHITDDYGLFNLEWSIECRCGSRQCRELIRRSDLDRHADRWDAWVREALAGVRGVDQPLWNVMAAETRKELVDYLDGRGAYRSVRALRWKGASPVREGRRVLPGS